MYSKLVRGVLSAVIMLMAASSLARAEDLLVWRPRTGTWHSMSSAGASTLGTAATQWGNQAAGDVPLSADIDGDGIGDLLLWRASTGMWYWLSSSTQYRVGAAGAVQWGNKALGDRPLVGDIDGDGRSDLIIWRASTGTWHWLTSASGFRHAESKQWGDGSAGDVPLVSDFDGDRRADLAVWRASSGTWFWLTSGSGYSYAAMASRQWGNRAAGDVPRPADIDGDGCADLAIWRASTGTWHWLVSSARYAYSAARSVQWGSRSLGDVPLVGDFDGDRRGDLAVWRASTGTWHWLTSASGYQAAAAGARQWGTSGDIPIIAPLFQVTLALRAPLAVASVRSQAGSTGGGAELRVLQWNTHHGGFGTDGAYRPDRIAAWVARTNADVVLFNEIEKNDYWGHEDQPELYRRLLQERTGRPWYYVFAQEFGDWNASGKGNLILSTYPIDAADRYELTRNGDRSIAMAQITVAGRPVTLLCTHLDPDNKSLRLAQATEITTWSAVQPENRILAGDMNAWPDQSSIAQLTKTYDDAWAVAAAKGTAYAFPGNAGETRKGRIDYIFYSKTSPHLTVKSSQVFDTRDGSGVMPSDHRPVLTTFVVR